MRKELEDRLVNLSQRINKLCNGLDRSFISEHLTKQIIRSSTSAALNYGEAQGAESKADFTHKVSIILKELRETQISLKLLADSVKEKEKGNMDFCKDECAQLVAIFHKTVITAKANK
jgi:four helix bundle protein